jgi:hypothetical protein
MSRDEVKSLNDLAMAHGGQLTINPETGLPEAGFLSAILPMVAGAALASTGVGAPMAAMMVGGGSYLLNPKAGLMGALSAGMGAYGGYGFGEGLTSLGATSEAGLTSTGASMDYAAQNAEAIKNAQAFEQAKLAQTAQANAQALESAKYLQDPVYSTNEFTQASAKLPFSPGGMNVQAAQPKFNIPGWSQESMQEYIAKGQPTNLSSSDVDFLSRAGGDPNKFGGPLQGAKYIGSDIEQFAVKQSPDSLLRNPLTENQLGQSATGSNAMMRGAKSLFTDPTGDKFKTLGGGSYMGLAKQGLMAAAPVVGQQAKLNMPAATSQKSIAPRYKFSPGMTTPTPAASATGVENAYFNPQYTAISDEEAKNIYGFAGGGPVEQMSNDNAIGANTGFPQAYLHNNAYATPYQTPISQNVLMGAGDVSVDPYTGEQRMAAGGMSYDPQTQRYTGGIADALPANTDVNIYNDTGGPGSGGGPASAPSSSSSTGSPTGSAIGDFGYAVSNQSISPIAAAIAAAAMDAMSPTSSVSANAVNGMDAASDAASAASAAAADADASGGAPGMGGGAGPGSASDGASGGDGAAGTGEARGGLSPRFEYHMAMGGLSNARYNLGGYSDGGRLLRGPGDGVSDSIPAVIGKKQPARLADGEFVVPARIVSEIGNGSTEAGARKLYAMMDRIQAARGKTVGKGKVAKNTRADKYLPA